MTMDEGLQLAIKMLKKVLNDNFKAERLDAAIIPLSTKQMEKVSKEKLEKFCK
jgi:20S proteasome alpha/beta subunit